MNCREVNELLYDYIDNDLDKQIRKEIETHLLSCASCSEELADIKSYRVTMNSLPGVKSPAGFSEQINSRIGKNYAAGIIKKLFFPLGVKLPLEAAGLLATAVIIILIYNPFESAKQALPVFEYAEKSARINKENLKESEHKKKKKAETVSTAASSALKTGKSIADAEYAADSAIIEIAFVSAHSKLQPSVPEEASGMDDARRSLYSAKLSGDTDKKDEAGSHQPAEEKRISSGKPASFNGLSRIYLLTSKYGGKILEKKNYSSTDSPEFILLEMPANNVDFFIKDLKKTGNFPELPAVSEKSAAQKIMIRFQE